MVLKLRGYSSQTGLGGVHGRPKYAHQLEPGPLGEGGRERHPHIRGRGIIGPIVLGGSDGIIENMALTSALNGAGLDFGTILLAGASFAIAGAVSMFFGNYLSARSELDTLRMDIERERMEIETEPEEERRELEDLLRQEGYGEREIDVILNRVTEDKELWLRAQLRHELHLHTEDVTFNPLSRAAPAGLVFLFGALIPLVPYLTPVQHFAALILSLSLSLTALFALGFTKLVTFRHTSVRNGIEMAIIGGVAALLLYGVGRILGSLW
jgi:VIT1/CCC1 family predicted Fe2+/Mn2+ transporter